MRLIDADALIEEMPTVMDMQDTYLPIHFKEWLIDEAPTIEPKRGAWITHDDEWGIDEECSVCKVHTLFKFDYCPHCGAEMREREDE